MPLPGQRWRHVTFGTKRSWLPADPRGFRSRRHRLHSSGDYNQPPPESEHAGLRHHLTPRLDPPITIPPALRPTIGQCLVGYLHHDGRRIIAAAVAAQHAHLLVELPDDLPTLNRIIGRAKSRSSRAVHAQMPGRIWADGADPKPVDESSHHHRALHYIKFKQEPGAWTWWYKEGIPEEWMVSF